jgi:Protein of unknown function (DUF2997)
MSNKGDPMDLEEIEVIIDKDGNVRIEVRGVKGTACLDLTRDLEAALGGEVELREMQPEAYEASPQEIEANQQQRLPGQ